MIFCGLGELSSAKQKEGGTPGDLALPHPLIRFDEPQKSRRLLMELKNGRLAMLGITGMMVGDRLSGGVPTLEMTFSDDRAWQMVHF